MNKPILSPKSVAITTGPLPGSRKLMLDGVPFREVPLDGGEAPVRLYDTSGPYTDDSAKIDIEKGLAPRRRDWILARGDVEELASYRTKAPGMPYAHPTVEHFTPLFVALGAASDPETPGEQLIDGYWMGLSKRSLQLA